MQQHQQHGQSTSNQSQMQYHVSQQQQQQQLGMKSSAQTLQHVVASSRAAQAAAGSATASGGYGYVQPPVQNPEGAAKPEPPKKPLTPYMMFSKSIWPQVKAANSHLSSVCEIGAVVGALWRDLNPVEKQKYNIQFNRDKERYDLELRSYLKTTGLLASDLVKPRPRRRDVKPTTPVRSHAAAIHRPALQSPALDAGHGLNPLANFSQTWTPQQQQQLLATMGLSAGVGQAVFANADGTMSNSTVANLLTGAGRGDNRQAGDVKGDRSWQQSRQTSNGPAESTDVSVLQAEIVHLRETLVEKDTEVLRLTGELDEALHTIEMYKHAAGGDAVGGVEYHGGQGIAENTPCS